ncbi:MAG: HEAT repeat domain-containing protein [Imperialibacter sp.]|uniref:HEAT repeat domain-containing protein n=1 Tax=Imperialibacter sp. TaxID=2038411 RepID=UPI003A8804B5
MIPIELIYFLNMLMATAAIGVVILIIVLKVRKKHRYESEKRLHKVIEKDLNNYLISSTENEGLKWKSVHHYQLNEIKAKLENNFLKGIFIGHLISLRKNLYGEFDEVLEDLYELLGLHELSIKKANSRRMASVVRGIHELSQFEYKSGYHHVLQHLGHSSQIVRQETQVALLNLSAGSPLFFLKTSWKDLSGWHILSLHHTLLRTGLAHRVQYDYWLRNPNWEVRAFIIDMCVFFRLVAHMDNIRGHLFSDEYQVQAAVLRAVTEMGDDRDAPGVYKFLVNTDRQDLKILSINALAKVGGPDEVEGLLTLLETDHSDTLLATVMAIEEISGNADELVRKSYDLQSHIHLATALAHIKEPLNNS